MKVSLCLSSKQVQDVLLLRRIYQLKLHGLKQQQTALASQMSSPSPYPFSDVVRVSNVTAQLRRNAAERYQLLHSFIKFVYFGVSHYLMYSRLSCLLSASDIMV